MPRGDGTVPMGMGPMTGRAAGFCAGYNVPGFMNQTAGFGLGMRFGRGRGLGMGGGRGLRNRFFAPEFAGQQVQQPASMTKEQELDSLKAALENLNKRIKELETTK